MNTFTDIVSVNALYAAAKKLILAGPTHNGALGELVKAVEQADKVIAESAGYATHIKLAQEQADADEDFQVDEHPIVSDAGEGGVWVSAWLWVPTPTEKWFAGYNMPGYMPDNEPAEFEDFDSAKRYIISMMKDFEDGDEHALTLLRNERENWPAGSDSWGGDCPVRGLELEEMEELAEAYCHGAEEVNLQSGEFSGQFGKYVFWVTRGE